MYTIQTLDLCNHQMKVQYCFPYHEGERLHDNLILSHYKLCFVLMSQACQHGPLQSISFWKIKPYVEGLAD